jgi:bifunctional DNA-binding transcriptional regulator/antitoxin component of YhaV-PrlF toxin-antitoxin module
MLKRAKITAGGQVSLPASVRRRWATKSVSFEDRGDHLVVRPLPDDPIEAAYGSLKGLGIWSDELRAIAREDERIAEERRQRA